NSYQVELSAHLKGRGIHNLSHALLLRIHKPNDDQLFPGRTDAQVTILDADTTKGLEWAVDKIIAHKGKGRGTTFEPIWQAGDHT
ncbi:hypothetical protein GLOTRDRAFT_28454, partial [Gloeophyllum trabeum ATCC 11539]